MSPYYPVLLKLEGRRCVVFGDGQGVDRRIGEILACGAEVTLIAPAVSAALDRLAEQGRIRWEAREYLPGDLEGVLLAILCLEDRVGHEEIRAEAESRGTPVDTLDDTPHRTYIFPATDRQGGFVAAVPALRVAAEAS
jgi:siroheme synthase-like protein